MFQLQNIFLLVMQFKAGRKSVFSYHFLPSEGSVGVGELEFNFFLWYPTTIASSGTKEGRPQTTLGSLKTDSSTRFLRLAGRTLTETPVLKFLICVKEILATLRFSQRRIGYPVAPCIVQYPGNLLSTIILGFLF